MWFSVGTDSKEVSFKFMRKKHFNIDYCHMTNKLIDMLPDDMLWIVGKQGLHPEPNFIHMVYQMWGKKHPLNNKHLELMPN